VVSGVLKVANTKTAKKQILINERNHSRNLHYKTRMKNVVKRVREILGNPDVPAEEANKALLEAQRIISQTHSKGIIHKNTASRKISRLAILFKKTHAPAPVIVEPIVETPVETAQPFVPIETVEVAEPVIEIIEPNVATEQPAEVEPVVEIIEPVAVIEPAEYEVTETITEIEPELSSFEPAAADFNATIDTVEDAVAETEPTFHEDAPTEEETK